MTDVKIPISVSAEQLQQLELEVREVHGRAQRAELEREQALRQLEQLTRDNVKLIGHVEDLRASRDQVLSTLETISRGYHSGNYAQLIMAMGEALDTLSKFKRSGR